MATLIDTPQYTSNEVYEIQATDAVEGAAIDASFSGLGISNQPHQQLANRSSFLKQRQDVNIASIGVLQSFMAGFVGSMQPTGYLKLPFADLGRGPIVAVVQWGFFSLMGQTQRAIKNGLWQVNFPLAFPNAAFWFQPQWVTNSLAGAGAMVGGLVVIESGPITKTTAQVFTDWNDAGVIHVADSSGDVGLTGFNWIAIGF